MQSEISWQKQGAFTDIVFPGSISNTAYGIWDNGDGSYTIAGGFSQLPVNNADAFLLHQLDTVSMPPDRKSVV